MPAIVTIFATNVITRFIENEVQLIIETRSIWDKINYESGKYLELRRGDHARTFDDKSQ